MKNIIIGFVERAFIVDGTHWAAAATVSDLMESMYGGIWGCVIGINPLTMRLMGGRDYIELAFGEVVVIVFKRNWVNDSGIFGFGR